MGVYTPAVRTNKKHQSHKSFGANIFMHCIPPGRKAAKALEPMP